MSRISHMSKSAQAAWFASKAIMWQTVSRDDFAYLQLNSETADRATWQIFHAHSSASARENLFALIDINAGRV